MPRFAIGFCLICLSILSPSASATVVGYQYSGIVNVLPAGSSPPYGIAVSSTATVSGTFWYDTEAVAASSDAFTVYYPQDHAMTVKFSAPGFEDLVATCFGYTMEVSNNLPQGPLPAVDRVSLLFDSILNPDSCWQVNGHPIMGEDPLPGMLRLSFKASSAARSDSSIPANLSFASQFQTSQLFADAPTGTPNNPDVIFMIQSFSSVPAGAEPPRPCPEPSSLVLLGLGATFAIALRRKRLGTVAKR